ncbi:MAG: hypothetical protein P8R42_12105 [Candidatus Binatia bacterium]|nr:hypothetical protein [Candidatus Binatia bacterium]
MRKRIRAGLAENGLVVVYAVLVALCAVYAPLKVIRFIYAEF